MPNRIGYCSRSPETETEEDELSSDRTLTERRVRAGQTIRVIIWLLVAVAVIVFAAVNTNKVGVDWVVDEARMPLWVVIALSAVAGAVIGFLARPNRS
ncbi:hypothetical protein BH24ACT6_BH24ACT6_01560 [soil metagenome]